MLCTPIVLPRTDITMRTAPLYASKPPVCCGDSELEMLKARVGETRNALGDVAWKKMVSGTEEAALIVGRTQNPPSRAYFKLLEIIRTCAIHVRGASLHLCEAPGGFAQATLDETDASSVVVTTLASGNVPKFATSLLRQKNVTVLADVPREADILCAEVRDRIVDACAGAAFVTADGASNNEDCPQLTEARSAILFLQQVFTALRVQAKGGTFVVKVFGLSMRSTLEGIALLTGCYATVSLLKPRSSRAVNDERYIVCQDFLGCPPTLPTLNRESGAYLCSVAEVAPAWILHMDSVVSGLHEVQKSAIRRALMCTEKSGRVLYSPDARQVRQSQKRGRDERRPR
jgi:23S rRNA U2552 (ribose-2'-O)-methylase RlmE/FtsJ